MAVSQFTMAHDTDPKDEILSKLGDLTEIDVANNDVLVAVYIRPDSITTKSGFKLYTGQEMSKEDKYQGKVGLVLKKGPMAFVDDESTKFHGQNYEKGDWVVFRPSDGWSVEVNGVLCRFVPDACIKARIARPDFVY